MIPTIGIHPRPTPGRADHAAVRRGYNSRCVLFRQGEPRTCLFLVKRGEVTLTMKDGDKEIRIRVGNGSLLGIPPLFGHQPCTMTAKATWDAEVLKLSSRAFMDLLKADTRAEQTLLDLLAGEVRAVRQAFLQLI